MKKRKLCSKSIIVILLLLLVTFIQTTQANIIDIDYDGLVIDVEHCWVNLTKTTNANILLDGEWNIPDFGMGGNISTISGCVRANGGKAMLGVVHYPYMDYVSYLFEGVGIMARQRKNDYTTYTHPYAIRWNKVTSYQKGTFTMASNALTVTTTISPVDVNHTVIFVQYESGMDYPSRGTCYVNLTNQTTIYAARNSYTTGSDSEIRFIYYVIEDSRLDVKRVDTTSYASKTCLYTAVPDVDKNHTFILCYFNHTTGSPNTNTLMPSFFLLENDTVLTKTSASATMPRIGIQLVSSNNFTVQHLSKVVTSSTTMANTPVDVNKSFVFVTNFHSTGCFVSGGSTSIWQAQQGLPYLSKTGVVNIYTSAYTNSKNMSVNLVTFDEIYELPDCPECPDCEDMLPGFYNPNPANGTYTTNYLENNTGAGLTTAVTAYFTNFTDPPAIIPGSYSMEFDSLHYDGPSLENNSGVYANVNANTSGRVVPGHEWVGQFESGGDYYIERSYLIFNTTTLPDEAVIDSAYISMVVYDDQSAVDFNVSLQQRRDPSPHNPMQPSDYFRNAFVGEYNTKNTSGYTDEDWFNFSLPIIAFPEIDEAGHTYFGLRSDQDVDQSAPVGPAPEYIGFYGPGGVEPWKAPHLIINYTIPSSNWAYIVNLTWSSNSSGSWQQYAFEHITSNGTYSQLNVNMTDNSTRYWWRVVAECDGTTLDNDTWWFETGEGASDVITITNIFGGIVYAVIATFFIVAGYLFLKRKKKNNQSNRNNRYPY
jgi:hypothetical protein